MYTCVRACMYACDCIFGAAIGRYVDVGGVCTSTFHFYYDYLCLKPGHRLRLLDCVCKKTNKNAGNICMHKLGLNYEYYI